MKRSRSFQGAFLMGFLLAALVLAVAFGQQTGFPGQIPEESSKAGEYAPASPYKVIQAVGFNGDWNLSGQTGVLKNTHQRIWEGVLYLPGGGHECRFAANRNWSVYWGSSAPSSAGLTGRAILQGGNIPITIASGGRYFIVFDDRTGDYSFSAVSSNLPPVARAGPDVTVVAGTIVHFDGADSYDSDGSIASYVWSNGMEGPTPVAKFDAEGIHEISLTVYDNASPAAGARDSMRVTVNAEIALDPDFRRETIYCVMVPRYYNGDQTNDFYCRERIKRDDPHWRGDFKGLIARLDYIKDLGFSAISVSPPVENRGGLDYSGAYAYDWSKIDPRLESPGGTFRDFIAAAHSRGLKVIQTVVLNHSSNYGIRGQAFIDRLPIKFYRNSNVAIPWPYTYHLGNYKSPFREDNDNPKSPVWFQDFLHRDEWGKGPLNDPLTNTLLPKDGYNPERFFGTDEKKLDSQWFHRNGWYSSADGVASNALQLKHIEKNAIDLATENWVVKSYLNSAVKKYLDWGVDAVRVDYAGNVDRNQLFPMVNDWKEHKMDLFVFADVEGKGSALGLLGADKLPSELSPWWYSKTGYDPQNPDSGGDSKVAVLDYALQAGFKDSIADGHFDGLGKILLMDWAYGDPTKLITFFHTFNFGPGKDKRYKFPGEIWKSALAYNVLWTLRGIPSIIAGEEFEFKKGAPMNPIGAADTLDTTARAYVGATLSDADVAVIQTQPLYQHIKRLNIIRSRIPALQKGLLLQGNEWISGMSFVRDYNNGESYAVLGLAAFSDRTISVDRVRNGWYADAVTGAVQEISSHTISFLVHGNSAGIWVLNGPGKIGEDGVFLR